MKLSVLLTAILTSFFITTAHAGKPVLSIVPVAGYNTTQTLNKAESAEIQYTVTNQAKTNYTPQMKPITGIVASGCDTPLASGQSCILDLTVTGADLLADINDGPILCNHGNALQCYRPSVENILMIHRDTTQYTVTGAGATGVTVNAPNPQQILAGDTATFSLTLGTGMYGTINPTLTNCPWDTGSWNDDFTQFTTGSITQNCTIVFDETNLTNIVFATFDNTASPFVSLDPRSVTQSIPEGNPATIKFIITRPGYYPFLDSSTCPDNGKGWNTRYTQYTTGPITTSNCQLVFGVTSVLHEVNAYSNSPNLAIAAQSVSQQVPQGNRAIIRVSSADGYYGDVDRSKTTCDIASGYWDAQRTQYTTGRILAGNCSIYFNAIPKSLTSTPAYSSLNPTVYQQDPGFTWTAPVISNDGTHPTGGVTFTVEGYPLTQYGCDQAVLINGVATCYGPQYTQELYPGIYNITATYPGDATHAPSQATFMQYVAETIIQATVPSQPLNITVTPASGTSAPVTVSWTPPTNTGGRTIDSYLVSYSDDSGTTWSSPAAPAPTTPSITITGLTQNHTYTFRVQASNTTGDGLYGYSSPITLPTQACPGSSGNNNGTIAVTPSTLALSAGGNARTITLTNRTLNNYLASAGITITNIDTSSLPAGTIIDYSQPSACHVGTKLSSTGSCTITVIPGPTTSNNCSNSLSAPTPSAITITATYPSSDDCSSNTGTVTANVLVLGYGCQYQGGFLFAIDDTTPITSSIGGKVVALSNQITVRSWGTDLDYGVFGISAQSTIANPDPTVSPATGIIINHQSGQLNCTGGIDGYCNTNNMNLATNPSTSTFASSYCTPPTPINGYSDWYLPAICEIGNASYQFPQCPSGVPNMVTNLPELLYSNCSHQGNCFTSGPNIAYWSSTESSTKIGTQLQNEAFFFQFLDNSTYQNGIATITDQFIIRCARAVTP
jgi:hypothetical protein